MPVDLTAGNQTSPPPADFFEQFSRGFRQNGQIVAAAYQVGIAACHELKSEQGDRYRIDSSITNGSAGRQTVSPALVVHFRPEKSRRVVEKDAVTQINLLLAGGDGRLVSHPGHALARQGVNQGRFADIRYTDNHGP